MPVDPNLDTKDVVPESNHIQAKDFPANWRADLLVTDVNVESFKKEGKQDKKKFVLSFAGKTKTFVLNYTNQAFLEAALGSKPARWIGATVTLSITKVQFQGQMVPGFLIIGAKAPANAPAETTDASAVPF